MNILITGASKGVGKEVALTLAENGSHILLLLSRNMGLLEKLKKQCDKRQVNSTIHVIPFDLNTLKSTSLLDIIKHIVDYLDVIINNAGFLIRKPYEEFTINEIRQIMETNFFVPAELIKQLLPLLQRSAISHVVNIGSMAGFQGSVKFPGLSYYSASKAALATLTECLAQEYKEKNIKFNCLALGAVQTEMMAEAFPDYKAPLNAKQMGAYIADFALNGFRFYNGKVLPVSLSTP